MKTINKLLLFTGLVLGIQSCSDNLIEPEVIKDPLTYTRKLNFKEESIRTGNNEWTVIDDGNIFSWLSNETTVDSVLQGNGGLAAYNNKVNLQTDFIYSIANDSVFAYILSGDSIFFPDAGNNKRTDLQGQIIFSSDTTLILNNNGVSPEISIRYKLVE